MIQLSTPNLIITHEVEMGVEDAESQADITKTLQENVKGLMGRKNVDEFSAALSEGNLELAEGLLLPRMNYLLRYSLAHEMKHAADKPSNSLYKLHPLIAEALNLSTATAVIYGYRLITLESNNLLYNSLLLTIAALPSYLLASYHSRDLVYYANPYEIRANSFAKRIANNSTWNDLISTENGWN